MSCAECVSGSVHKGTPVGEEITLAGLSTYATGDPASLRIVVFGVDIFGWRFNNTRLLADEYAARGFRVYVPDLFDGNELPQWTLSSRDPTNDKPTVGQRILRPISLFVLVPFVLRNNKGAQSSKFSNIVKHLREAQPSAKIGFVGFCWGGRYAISQNAEFDATVAAHPSMVQYPVELDGVKKPISFAIAKTDHNYDEARARESEKILKGRGLEDVEVVIYEKSRHGWTIRSNLADPEQKEARDKARDQAIAWFEKYLVVDTTVAVDAPASE